MRTRRREGLIVIVGVLALICLTTNTVSAHAHLQTSDPADKAVLSKAPTQIYLAFTAKTSLTKSGGSVMDAGGAPVSTGFAVDPSDTTKMTIDLKPNLPNGAYTVKWNTLAEDDGGEVNDVFTFSVQAPASVATPLAATGGTTSASISSIGSGGSTTMSHWMLIAVIIFGTVTIFAAGIAIGTRAQHS